MKTKPFKNCFWLRNPGVAQSFFKIEPNSGVETFIANQEEQDRLNEIKAMFLATDEVKQHFIDPEEAWNAVLKENDGGTKYVLEHLSSVCKSDTKINQLNGIAQNLAKDLRSTLYDFYVPTDNAEKERVSKEKLDHLKSQLLIEGALVDEGKFSLFLQQLGLDENFLQARLADVSARNLEEYVKNIFEIWGDHVKSASSQISRDFVIDKSSIEFLVHELTISMSINNIDGKINERISFLNFQGLTRSSKLRAIEISTFIINDFISEQLLDAENTDQVLNLEENSPDLQKDFARRWISAFEAKVLKNVSSEDGVKINQKANTALEKIIKELASINE